MVDEQVLLAKITQVRRHLSRVRSRLPDDLESFLRNDDLRDVVVHNLWLALQGCIDIAAHTVADEGLGQPTGIADLFDLLGQKGIVTPLLASRLRKAAGLRNVIVHEYVRLDLDLIFRMASEDLIDLDAFLLSVAERFNLAGDA